MDETDDDVSLELNMYANKQKQTIEQTCKQTHSHIQRRALQYANDDVSLEVF